MLILIFLVSISKEIIQINIDMFCLIFYYFTGFENVGIFFVDAISESFIVA